MELKDQIKIILYKKTVQIKEENMSKSKVHMPKELEKKCHIAIHAATTAAAAAGAIPLPMADAGPITAAQIGMIVSLGKIFDITITQATAKSIAGIVMAQKTGRFLFTNILKSIPGAGTVAGGIVGASTAVALTEALGWIVADDFFRIYNGEESERIQNIVNTAGDIQGAFDGLRMTK